MIDETPAPIPAPRKSSEKNGNHFPDFHHDHLEALDSRIAGIEAAIKRIEGKLFDEESNLDAYSIHTRLMIIEERIDQLIGRRPIVDPLKTVL